MGRGFLYDLAVGFEFFFLFVEASLVIRLDYTCITWCSFAVSEIFLRPRGNFKYFYFSNKKLKAKKTRFHKEVHSSQRTAEKKRLSCEGPKKEKAGRLTLFESRNFDLGALRDASAYITI